MYYNNYEYPMYSSDQDNERFLPLAIGLGLGTFGFGRPFYGRPFFGRPFYPINPFYGFGFGRPWFYRRRRRFWY